MTERPEKIIFAVVWWSGMNVRTENFLKSENADAFEKNVRKSGQFIARGKWHIRSDIQYNAASKKCHDYEPPKKF